MARTKKAYGTKNHGAKNRSRGAGHKPAARKRAKKAYGPITESFKKMGGKAT